MVASFIRDLQEQGLQLVDENRLARPLSKSSVQNYCKPLQQTLAFAARRGWIASSPWSLLTSDDMPTRNDDEESPHEWTSDELDALLVASRTLAATRTSPESRPFDYSTLLLVAVRLGLRLSECLGLQWADFDKGEAEDSALLRVERQWLPPIKVGDVRLPARYGKTKTKAGKRTLDLPVEIREALIALRLRSPFSQDGHPIFASRAGTPLTHRNVTLRGFEAARDAAKLDTSLVFHDLRHAAASRLIAAGLDPVTVAGVLGHKDPTVTLRVYAHQFDRRQKAKGDRVRAALAGVAEVPAEA
jgi:integrase